MRQSSHQDAVMALIAPTYEIQLKVRHDPPPKGLQVKSSWLLVDIVEGYVA